MPTTSTPGEHAMGHMNLEGLGKEAASTAALPAVALRCRPAGWRAGGRERSRVADPSS